MDEQEAGTASSQEEQENEPAESEPVGQGTQSVPEEDKRDPQAGQPGDALAWMEGPAFRAPIEEMPTLQWPDAAAETDAAPENEIAPEPNQAAGAAETSQPQDDLQDAIFFLEELAKEQGTPIEAMPTLVSKEGELDQDMGQLGATTQPPLLDSDPMAWLEQLAIDQNSPLEELPSVANRLLASEIVSQYDVDTADAAGLEPPLAQSAELDEALQYLEEQARAQGISLDEVTIDEAEPAESTTGDLDVLDKIAVAAATAAVMQSDSEQPAEEPELEAELLNGELQGETEPPADTTVPVESVPLAAESEEEEWDDLSAQIPEDPDAALAWLGALAGEEESPAEEKDRSALAKGAAAAGVAKLIRSHDGEGDDTGSATDQDAAELRLDAVVLEGMPDDPDEAMAWMEGLAEQEGAEGPSAGAALADAAPAQPQEFTLARAALTAGAIAEATEEYRKLLDGGQGGPDLIGELETAVAAEPEEPELVRLLGDAYMQDGQMQKALKTYSKGFDQK